MLAVNPSAIPVVEINFNALRCALVSRSDQYLEEFIEICARIVVMQFVEAHVGLGHGHGLSRSHRKGQINGLSGRDENATKTASQGGGKAAIHCTFNAKHGRRVRGESQGREGNGNSCDRGLNLDHVRA